MRPTIHVAVGLIKQLTLLLLVGVVASGCSVKLAYNNLDRLARWSVNDYLNMNDSQRAYFDDAVDELLYWHRTEHLPRYASFISAVEVSFADGTDGQEMQSMVNAVLGWAAEIESRGMPIAIELLASLDDQQVAAMARRLEERNLEWEEPEVGKTLEQAQAAWAEEFIDRFSRFSGRLTPAQMAHVDRQSVRYIPEMELWADYRRRWQADLLKLLEHRHDLETFAPAFVQLAAARESYYGTELTAIFDSNIALTRDLSVWLVNNLTPKQQERLFQRLNDLAADLRELADAAPEQAPYPESCLLTC